MNKILYKSESFVLGKCRCGCGTDLPKLISRPGHGKPSVLKQYALNHNQRGITRSLEFRRNLSEKRMGSNNPAWKGDDVSYTALHDYIKWHLPKPELCEYCHKAPSYDLACVTQKYERGLDNWKYLCRKCHMLSDGRLINFLKSSRNSRKQHMIDSQMINSGEQKEKMAIEIETY